MYAKIKDNQLVQYPYSYTELQVDNPYTNFNGVDVYEAFQGTEANLAGYTLAQVETAEQPQFDYKTQQAMLATTPVLQDGKWVLQWAVTAKTAEELAQQAAFDATEYQRLRAAEYPPMADYLDGVVKGDQAQVQAYIDACLAVKAKYPKPE